MEDIGYNIPTFCLLCCHNLYYTGVTRKCSCEATRVDIDLYEDSSVNFKYKNIILTYYYHYNPETFIIYNNSQIRTDFIDWNWNDLKELLIQINAILVF